MTTPNNNSAAFPCLERGGSGLELTDAGMTLRDYFAAKAMQGLLSDPNIKASTKEFAAQAYAPADAMLKARSAE